MHGVRPVLHRAQANALGIPISFVDVPDGSNEAYADAMQDALSNAETVVFADLFLEDVREYRESLVEEVHIEPEFPLWQRDTRTLFESFVDAGFRAKIVVVDGTALSPAWLGEELTPGLIDSFPDTVDPCGENGEFHTFVWDGPSFEWPVRVRPGRRVTRTLGEADYHYLDLLPRG